jgi:hypothetical protein
MADSHVNDIEQLLESALLATRQQALYLFIEKLMPVLVKRGYQFDDLLEQLVEWCERSDVWAGVTEDLVRAANKASELRRQLSK